MSILLLFDSYVDLKADPDLDSPSCGFMLE